MKVILASQGFTTEEMALADNPFTVYAVTDTQAVAYIDGEIKYIGGKPKILGKINEVIK